VEAAISIDRAYLEQEQQRQLEAIKQRQQLFRGGRGSANVTGRSAILTDDGIATGSTMMAAIRVVKAHKPRELIVAVPVAPAQHVAEFRGLCDQFIYLLAPADFSAVGEFYRSFQTVEDDEVIRLLTAAKTTQQPV
jgi:predicted phosphoribosyltransferase